SDIAAMYNCNIQGCARPGTSRRPGARRPPTRATRYRVETSAMALDTTRPVLQSVGNYDLIEKIAEGGMGTVYKARQRDSGATVAIKIVPPHMASNPVLLKRFEQEFRAAKLLDHPNIVRALDFGTHGSSPYLVMELVEGESLGQRLERERR